MLTQGNWSSFLLLILIGIAIYYLLNTDEGFSVLKGKNINEPFSNSSTNQSVTASNNLMNTQTTNSTYVPSSNTSTSSVTSSTQSTTPTSMSTYTSSIDSTTPTSMTTYTSTTQSTTPTSMTTYTSSVDSTTPTSMTTYTSSVDSTTPTSMTTFTSSVDSTTPTSNVSSTTVPMSTYSDNTFATIESTTVPTTLQTAYLSSTTTSEPSISQSLINEIATSSNQPVSGSSTVQLSSSFNFQPSDENIFDDFGSTLDSAFGLSLSGTASSDSIDFKKQNVDSFNAKDFLPKEVNDEWFETDFSLAKYQLNDDKLINTEKYIIGINTVGESLKNASYDIRGTIPNPKFVVSPWNNSTYEPDFNIKPLY